MKVKSLKEFFNGINGNTDIIIKISHEDGREEVAKVDDAFHQGNELVLCGYEDNNDEVSHNGYDDNFGYNNYSFDEEYSIAGNYRDY